MLSKVKAIIEQYKLQPLPVEGTLFLSTYRSKQEFDNGIPYGTAIIALHCNEPYSISLFHKLPADEIWHFYSGNPLRLILLYPDGTSKDVIMGNKRALLEIKNAQHSPLRDVPKEHRDNATRRTTAVSRRGGPHAVGRKVEGKKSNAHDPHRTI